MRSLWFNIHGKSFFGFIIIPNFASKEFDHKSRTSKKTCYEYLDVSWKIYKTSSLAGLCTKTNLFWSHEAIRQ